MNWYLWAAGRPTKTTLNTESNKGTTRVLHVGQSDFLQYLKDPVFFGTSPRFSVLAFAPLNT
ncbi:hypothetical protein ARMSODRAFT_957815 [Armillaria solidipes]|uniref:Uncharacterized protein n=1 Tax=Armillaria solidipes TaxID=1076256 RepID=A0A2H3BD04_9AGAR|nr:hypothetical protein ARMSODRAFT_957815 [Armillaria solidipes]